MAIATEKLIQIASSQPYPLLFTAISGAHLYGFASPDSDYDLRGVHCLPLHQIVGLHPLQNTIKVSKVTNYLELDLVTHDLSKFFCLLLNPIQFEN